MMPLRIACTGLDSKQREHLRAALQAQNRWQLCSADDAADDGDADIVLLSGSGTTTPLPAVPAIAVAMSAEALSSVAARHPLLYSTPALPDGTQLGQWLHNLLSDPHGRDGARLGAPELAPESIAQLQEQHQALLRALVGAGAISVQLHLAEQRCAPILVLGPAPQDCIANAHAEGLGALCMRSGQDVVIADPGRDARARPGLDYPQGSGELPMVVLQLGARHVAGQDWQVVLSLRALGIEPLAALTTLARALADALWPNVSDGLGSSAAAQRLYRPAAVAAMQQGDRELAWPAFAPAWTRRYTRLWRWPLLLSPLLLWLPLAPGVSGEARVLFADAPPIISPMQASVIAIEAAPGDRVRAGDVLLRLSDPTAEQRLEEVWSNYRAQLRQSLRAPEDQSLAASLAQQWERVLNARGRRELALLTPVDGRVVELPISVGAHVSAGAQLALVQPEHGRAMVEMQIPLKGMSPVTEGTRGWLVLADGSERSLVVRSLGAVVRSDDAVARRTALAELGTDAAAALPGEHGVVHLALPSRPLYQHLWYALGGATR